MNETFWEAMRRVAEVSKGFPDWAKAGINLTERNYETFKRDKNDPRH